MQVLQEQKPAHVPTPVLERGVGHVHERVGRVVEAGIGQRGLQDVLRLDQCGADRTLVSHGSGLYTA